MMTAETGVRWLLRFISITTLPAFVAAVMPQRWLVAVLTWIEPGFPPGLFGTYVTRCLMGLYALLGVQCVIWSSDVRRYRPLILTLCVCVVTAVPMALAALVIAVPQAEHGKAFWIIVADLTEGLAHTALLAVLIRYVPRG